MTTIADDLQALSDTPVFTTARNSSIKSLDPKVHNTPVWWRRLMVAIGNWFHRISEL